MNFLAPWAFALAFLIPLIVLLYLLRLRRPERIVSSTYLWRRIVRDLQADTPWQRLRPNLLLLLQLLFLVALILAIAQPFTWGEGFDASAAIIILDTSASMGATDVVPNRMEAAKDQAHRLVDDLPTDAPLTIIAAAAQVQVLLSNSSDRRQAHQAINEVQFAAAGSDMGIALQIAGAIASRQPKTQVIIYSDGGVDIPEYLDLPGDIKYQKIGQRGENQAISQLTFEQLPGAESPTAFVQVTNYGASPASRRLALSADGALVHAQDLQLAPGEASAVVVSDLPTNTLQVEAQLQLSPSDDSEFTDDLPLDDIALAVKRREDPALVTLATEGNRFMETALSLLPGLTLTRVQPENVSTLPEADLTIIDGSLPPTMTLPAGNLLFIGPIRSTEFFTITGNLENPIPRNAAPDEPLLANLDIETISVLEAAWIDLPDWAQPLIIADPGTGYVGETPPLFFAGEVNGRRIAVLAFDLHRSDLPLQVSFPILLANLMEWLSPKSGGVPFQIAPGDPLTLALPPGEVDSVTLLRPDGSRVNLALQNGYLTTDDTLQLGLYEFVWSGGDRTTESLPFTVNLFNPRESSTAPSETLRLVAAENVELEGLQDRARQEWWRTFASLALLLLFLEWLVYQRPAITRIIHRLRRRRPQSGIVSRRP